jgi:uncharacterized protein (DUF1501 family)
MSDDHVPASAEDLRLMQASAEGCEESRLLWSRRALLGMGVGLFSAAIMPKTALAGSTSDPRLLLVILRGGMDGLDALAPVGDPQYMSRRQQLAIANDKLLPLAGTSFFRLNPALATFQSLYDAGEAAFVPATCIPVRTRSHFDCQDNLENGMPTLGVSSSGWLNRALSVLGSTHPVRVGGGLGVQEAPIVLRGSVPTYGWSLNWLQGVDATTLNAVKTMYLKRDKAMYGMLTRGLKAHQIATAAGGQNKAEAEDPNMSRLRKGFRGAARLLASNAGPRIAVITVDDFDTHGHQGAILDPASDIGHLYKRLAELDTGVADFKSLVGATAWANTVVIAVSEFGRKVEPNGSLGTDHGVGGIAMLAGGAVKGGIHGAWPGLNTLYQGVDLVPTVDTRSVFKGILRDHFKIGKTALDTVVFPGSGTAAPAMNGLVKPAGADLAMSDVPSGSVGWRDPKGIAAYRERYGTTVTA